jgi:Arc/MetJ-type ribon-helix-helix transcriptional regulator
VENDVFSRSCGWLEESDIFVTMGLFMPQQLARATKVTRPGAARRCRPRSPPRLHIPRRVLYGECMARLISTTVRLHEEDVRALKRARAAGHSASELVRKGLRVVASRYYKRRRPPSTLLFESTDTKLGDESQLFRDLER